MSDNYQRRPLFITCLIFGAIAIALFWILNEGASADYNRAIGVIGFFIIVWCIISNRIIHGKYISLILMFECSFYILTAGQSFLYAFNISFLGSKLDLYVFDSAVDVNRAYIFNFMCLMLLHIGTMLRPKQRIKIVLGKRQRIDSGDIGADITPDYAPTMKKIGWLVFAVSSLPYTIGRIQLYSDYLQMGYREAYISSGGSTSWSKLPDFIGSYFIFSVFLLMVAYKDNKKMRTIMEILVLVVTIINFAVGNRSEPICYVFAMFWFKILCPNSKSEKRFSYIMLATFIFAVFLVIPIIGATRNDGTLSFKTIVDALSGKNSFINMTRETFISMGWSGFPLVKTMKLIPEVYDYHYGQSYFFALLAVIPNVFGGTHIAVQYAGLPAWLMKVLNMSYGPGYSMSAEAYYNFGWFGMLVMIPLGMLINKLLGERFNKDNLLIIFAKIGLFVVLFSVPRREMLTAIRSSVYYVGFLYFMVWLLHRPRTKA